MRDIAVVVTIVAALAFAAAAEIWTSRNIDPHLWEDEDPGDDAAAWRPRR